MSDEFIFFLFHESFQISLKPFPPKFKVPRFERTFVIHHLFKSVVQKGIKISLESAREVANFSRNPSAECYMCSNEARDEVVAEAF